MSDEHKTTDAPAEYDHEELLRMAVPNEETGEDVVFKFNSSPEYISIPEAVKRLVDYFAKCDVCTGTIHHLDGTKTEGLEIWNVPGGDWIAAIRNGKHSPAAVRVGLEDLFCSILEGDEI